MVKVLFVCSGNTCRSPMAEAVFNQFAKDKGIEAVASSAGFYTQDGLAYSENTAEVLRLNKIPFAGTSRQISEQMIQQSDYVFGLTYSLSTAMIAAYPQFADKIYRFPVEVADPFGGDITLYKRCYVHVCKGVERILAHLAARGTAHE